MSSAVPRYSQEWLDAYRKRVRASLAPSLADAHRTPADGDARLEGNMMPYDPAESAEVPFCPVAGKMTKTEERYNRDVLGGKGRFEAVTLRLPGGGRYTPDFMTLDDGIVTFHEVKGSYRLGSQGRAYTAFHDAAASYPMWKFVWAHWTGKAWERRVFQCGSKR